jgi:hypothetical protein
VEVDDGEEPEAARIASIAGFDDENIAVFCFTVLWREKADEVVIVLAIKKTTEA